MCGGCWGYQRDAWRRQQAASHATCLSSTLALHPRRPPADASLAISWIRHLCGAPDSLPVADAPHGCHPSLPASLTHAPAPLYSPTSSATIQPSPPTRGAPSAARLTPSSPSSPPRPPQIRPSPCRSPSRSRPAGRGWLRRSGPAAARVPSCAPSAPQRASWCTRSRRNSRCPSLKAEEEREEGREGGGQ